MTRAVFLCLLGSVSLLGMGCTMCEHPYDYCGPTISPAGPEPGNVRAGSILGHTAAVEAPADVVIPAQATEPASTAPAAAVETKSIKVEAPAVPSEPASPPAVPGVNQPSGWRANPLSEPRPIPMPGGSR